jgi:hypothetical protein
MLIRMIFNVAFLFKDYKKKDKKAKRVQRNKDNENISTWKKTSFDHKNFKKRKNK